MENSSTLGVDEGDIEESLEVVPGNWLMKKGWNWNRDTELNKTF